MDADTQFAEIREHFEKLCAAVEAYRDGAQRLLDEALALPDGSPARIQLLRGRVGTSAAMLEALETAVLSPLLQLVDNMGGPWSRAVVAGDRPG